MSMISRRMLAQNLGLIVPGVAGAAFLSRPDMPRMTGPVAPSPEFSTRRMTNTGRGAVVLTIDDAFATMRNLAELLNERGQRGTFCVTTDLMNNATTKITAQDIVTISDDGHEIAAHSKTHANMTQLTAAQRAVEYDHPKKYLEDLTRKPVTTWAYPFGTGSGGRNVECDQQAYLRYSRLLDTSMNTTSALYPRYSDAPPFLINRTCWSESNHQQIMGLVRHASDTAVLVSLFFHTVDAQWNPTTSQLHELLDTCRELDVPLLTVSEAFTSPHLLVNGGFEDAGDVGHDTASWRAIQRGSGSVSVVSATPDASLGGTKSLRLSTADSYSYALVRQQVQVVPGREYVLSGRCKAVSAKTPANLFDNKAIVRVQPLDYGQSPLSQPTVQTVLTTADVGQGWKRFSIKYSASQEAKSVNIALVLQAVGDGAEVYFDHIWFGARYLGDLG